MRDRFADERVQMDVIAETTRFESKEAFQATLRKCFDELNTTGTDPDLAAAYALRWASGTAQPVDVPRIRALSGRIVAHGSAGRGNSRAAGTLEELACDLFEHPEVFIMSLLVHCKHVDAPKHARSQPAAPLSSRAVSSDGDAYDTCSSGSAPPDAAWERDASLRHMCDSQQRDASGQLSAPARSAPYLPGATHVAVTSHAVRLDPGTCTDAGKATQGSSASGGRAGAAIDLTNASELLGTLFAAVDVMGADNVAGAERVVSMARALLLDAAKLPRALLWCPATVQAQVLAVLLCLPQMQEDVTSKFMRPFVDLCTRFLPICGPDLVRAFAHAPRPLRAAAVFAVQQHLTFRLYSRRVVDRVVAVSADLLQVLYDADVASHDRLPHDAFYNDAVNAPDFDLREDWDRHKDAAAPRRFSFCRYPFLYAPAAKAQFVQFETVDTIGDGLSPLLYLARPRDRTPLLDHVLLLNVRRTHLLQDAVTQVRAASSQDRLKRPLKVRFVGEQGVDEGGVAREFFELLVRQLFAPQFGMFEVLPEAGGAVWIRPSHLSALTDEFELIGIVVGLAIINAHVLDLRLAPPLYKHLLGHAVTFDDLAAVHPGVHNSLRALLDYPCERVQADMQLTWQVEYEMDFCTNSKDLIPGGGDIAVTGSNRQAFVDAYTRFLLTELVQPQLDAFKRGFARVCDSPVFAMFDAPELEQVVCGTQDIDFAALRRGARYDGGFSKDSETVQWFWRTLDGFGDHEKRQFLQFVTSSTRVPVGGLDAMQPPFCVMRNGPHSSRLPTAHTCFNTLLLPQYESEGALRERLAVALENTQGFGLM